MDKRVFEARREKLRAYMHKAGMQALLVTLDANRYYLSGFELHDPQLNESAGCLIIAQNGRNWLCTDSRYDDAAKRLWDNDSIFIYRGNAMQQINALIKQEFSGATIGFEAKNISLSAFEQVSDGLRMERADGMIEALRVIKEPEEVLRLEQSCRLNHKMMDWLPGVLQPGRSEKQVAWDIEQFFRNNGAEELSFSSIVAVDGNAALPHAVPDDTLITENCGVLVDVGCRMRDYCSDQTRSFWVGDKPSATFERDLACIQEAQTRAIKVIAPGVATSAVYAAARAHLEEQGVGKLFTHGLGHGVGLQTHESPSLSPTSPTILQPGMIVTVEPGLYRPGVCGVRWEYMVLVTEDGARIL